MGSKIGPVYDILTLAYLEETKLYPKVKESYSEEYAGSIEKKSVHTFPCGMKFWVVIILFDSP